jgi:hypothetical protein
MFRGRGAADASLADYRRGKKIEEMIGAFTSRLTLIALIWAASCLSAGAQSAPVSTAPQIRIDATASPPAPADDASALAEKLQNPIADLISIPFQNNTNFNVGPSKGTQDILNIQPVIPIHANDDWNVITRTILPLVWSPSFQPDAAVPPFGLSPITFSAFLSPTRTIGGPTVTCCAIRARAREAIPGQQCLTGNL